MEQEEIRKPGRPKGTGRPSGSIPYLTPDQLSLFFQEIRKEKNPERRLRNELAFRLTVHFAMRVSEVTGLLRSDIHLDTGEIQIAGVKRGAIRTYSIPEELLPLLKRWIKKAEGESLFGISRELLQFTFKKIAREAGLPSSLSIHSLRHTTAILMTLANASPIRVQMWLRQRNVASAQKYFQAVQFKDDDRKMSQLFKGIF